jgi:hypothetical protein
MGNHARVLVRALRSLAPLAAAAAMVATTLVASAAPATAMRPVADRPSPAACVISQAINATTTAVSAHRERECGGDPGDIVPLPTTIQKKQGSTWVDVATGIGGARYACKGSALTTYRLKQATSVQDSANCS